jgi:hypothetical protein
VNGGYTRVSKFESEIRMPEERRRETRKLIGENFSIK